MIVNGPGGCERSSFSARRSGTVSLLIVFLFSPWQLYILALNFIFFAYIYFIWFPDLLLRELCLSAIFSLLELSLRRCVSVPNGFDP